MNFFYSDNSDYQLFNGDSSNIFNGNMTLHDDEGEYNQFINYDCKLFNKIAFEENDTSFQNSLEFKKGSGIEDIIDNKNYSNYSDKSTNEEESPKKSFLNKKRKNIFFTKKVPKADKLNNNSQEKKLEKRGRKSQFDTKEGKHNKLSDDNIINKIKVHLFYYIRDIIKQNSNEQIDLKKIGNKFTADHKINKNMRQYKMKIRDILMEEEISTKYSTLDKFENRKIIEEIYQKQEDKKVIQILELTFEEILILFRKNLDIPEDKWNLSLIAEKIKGLDLIDNYNKYEDIDYFINELIEKYKDKISTDELEEYISNIKRLCSRYINWFQSKTVRP